MLLVAYKEQAGSYAVTKWAYGYTSCWVGWKVDPFGAEIIDGKIYGRGVEDMKAGLAAIIMASGAIYKAQDLISKL